MSKQKDNSQGNDMNPTDEFLNRDQEGEISRQESVEQEVFDVNADDLLHAPENTSQEHSLDDTHETLTSDGLETDPLTEAADNAMKKNDQA